MGRGKRWSPHEKAIAAKAYREAALDPISGADQRAEDFKTTSGNDDEVKKLRLAFERCNDQVDRRNAQHKRMQQLNQMKYVIELCKDDDNKKQKVEILKTKLLDATLKVMEIMETDADTDHHNKQVEEQE